PQGPIADPSGCQPEGDRARRQNPVYDLEARRLVLTGDDPHARDPHPERPRAECDERPRGAPAHGVPGQPEARSIAARHRSTAAADAFAIGMRTSGVAIRPCACSTPLHTPGFGSANPVWVTGHSPSAG